MTAEDQNKRSRAAVFAHDATHLRGVHAATTLALATTLERLHLAILLHKHRLCVWPPADADADASTHAYAHVWWHAANRTRRGHALPLPLAKNEDSWLVVVLAQRVLSNRLGL